MADTPGSAAAPITLAQLAQEKYLQLTTFRRTGEPVATAVWVVPDDGGGALIITDARTGKVKRIRHTPRVLLRPSDQRGRVAPGAPELTVTAEIFDDPAQVDDLSRRIVAKYGLFARVFSLVTGLIRRIRRTQAQPCGLRLRAGSDG